MRLYTLLSMSDQPVQLPLYNNMHVGGILPDRDADG